ncbi:hypothetical protein [Natronospora cellulosivora (SeqCode)]
MISKKFLILSLLVVLVFSFVLVGCGTGDYEDFDFEENQIEDSDPFVDDFGGNDFDGGNDGFDTGF